MQAKNQRWRLWMVCLILSFCTTASWAKTPLSEQPSKRTLSRFEVQLQTKMQSDDVLHIHITGRHSTQKNAGLRLRRISLVLERSDPDETVYRIQGHYQRIFGKESADYLREGVPFRVHQRIPITIEAKRYVVRWGDAEQTVIRPVAAGKQPPHFKSPSHQPLGGL